MRQLCKRNLSSAESQFARLTHRQFDQFAQLLSDLLLDTFLRIFSVQMK
jgi:hypothetical protein